MNKFTKILEKKYRKIKEIFEIVLEIHAKSVKNIILKNKG